MSILDYYAKASYIAMMVWTIAVIAVDIAIAFSERKRDEFGYLVINPIYWAVLAFLLPFLNILLSIVFYLLLTKGSTKNKGKK